VQKAVLDAINDYFAAFGKNPAAPKPAIGAEAQQKSLKDQVALDQAQMESGEARKKRQALEAQLLIADKARLELKRENASDTDQTEASLKVALLERNLIEARKKEELANEAFRAAEAKVNADARAKPAVVKETSRVSEAEPPKGETDAEKQARIKKESEAEKSRAAEAAEKAKSAETKAAEAAAKKAADEAAAKKAADEAAAKKAADEAAAKDKSKAKETANITVLDNGARVLDDVLELVKQGVPVVSNVRTQKEQEALVDHTDDKGNRFTKENLPVAENSKHLTGDALDVRTKDMTKDLEKILKDNGWMRPLPKSDPGHWQRVPKPKEKKASEVVPNDVDLASALSQAFDLSDATAGLTINSDVATLNSKGMNVSLDNSADVAKMIAAISPDMAEAFRSSSQADQSAAKANFESSMGDVKSALSEQKATNVALLDAMQELIRIQKNSVDVQQKIYNVTA